MPLINVVISHELNMNSDANLHGESGVANYRNIIEDVIVLNILPRNELFTANEAGYTVPDSYQQIQLT